MLKLLIFKMFAWVILIVVVLGRAGLIREINPKSLLSLIVVLLAILTLMLLSIVQWLDTFAGLMVWGGLTATEDALFLMMG